MLNKTAINATKKGETGKRGSLVKFPGITEDARTLGVSRIAIYQMLMNKPGWGNLHKLRRRYMELVEKKPPEVQAFIKANIVKQ